jgi:hypothetical protein
MTTIKIPKELEGSRFAQQVQALQGRPKVSDADNQAPVENGVGCSSGEVEKSDNTCHRRNHADDKGKDFERVTFHRPDSMAQIFQHSSAPTA